MQEINLYDLLKFYAKKWLIILLLTVLGAGVGVIYNTYLQTPLYKSDATLLLIDSAQARTTTDDTLINNYVELFKSRRVLEPVIAGQKVNMSYGQLIAKTQAAAEKDTEIIKVSIAAKNAQTSKNLLNGAIKSFKTEVAKLYGADNVEIVDEANLASQPYNVHKSVQLGLSTLVGSSIAIVTLFFIYDYSLSKTAFIITEKPIKVSYTDKFRAFLFKTFKAKLQSQPVKKGRGRPKGSTNISKSQKAHKKVAKTVKKQRPSK